MSDGRVVMNCHCMDMRPDHEQCHPMCHQVAICQSRKLLQTPVTDKFYADHISYLNTFVADCKDGFYINDLMHLNRVLQMLAKRLETTPAYVPIFKRMLEIAAIPPLIQDVSDTLTGLVHFAEYLSILGLLPAWFERNGFRALVYKALSRLLTNESPLNLAGASVGYRYIATEHSYLPEIIAQMVESVPQQEYNTILNLCLQLTHISPAVCRKMVQVNVLNFLLIRLVPDRASDPTYLSTFTDSKAFADKLNKTCAVLLNLLDALKGLEEAALAKLTPDPELMWILRYVLRGVIVGQVDKMCRNNLMAVVLLCLDTFPHIHLVECNLFSDLASLSVATETGMANSWAKSVVFVNNDYDICFKKMLLASLCFMHKYETLHMVFENQHVIAGLLRIIAPDYKPDWHPDTHESFKKYALIALFNIVPRLITDFVRCNGTESLLILIESYIMAPNDTNRALLEESLKCLAKFTETKHDVLLEDLRKNNGISMITLLCTGVLAKPALTSFDQVVLLHGFCILGKLYSNHPIPIETPVTLITKYLHRVVQPSAEDSYLDTRAIICAVDLLWEIIRYDHDKLVGFLQRAGVYVLLDTIQRCPLPVQVIGLGCLVDLCDEGLCIPYLLTWRGGECRQQIFFALLADIFRTECQKLRVDLTDTDIIKDTEYPLMGQQQRSATLSATKDPDSSPALLDLFGSARPKVYALLQLLKVRYQDKVELTNEHYKISYLPLSARDKVVLHLAENFFALKLAEAWKELVRDLANANITPVLVDAQMLNVLTGRMHVWNETVQREQHGIVAYESGREALAESNVYDRLQQCRLGPAIEALRELRYFAKIADVMFRLGQKQRQRAEVGMTPVCPVDYKCSVHRTYMDRIDVTSVFHLKFNLAFNRK